MEVRDDIYFFLPRTVFAMDECYVCNTLRYKLISKTLKSIMVV